MRVWVIKRSTTPYLHSDYTSLSGLHETRFDNDSRSLRTKTWPGKISQWFVTAAFLGIGLAGLWVVLMGVIAALYLLPIWGSVLFVYWLTQQRR